MTEFLRILCLFYDTLLDLCKIFGRFIYIRLFRREKFPMPPHILQMLPLEKLDLSAPDLIAALG